MDKSCFLSYTIILAGEKYQLLVIYNCLTYTNRKYSTMKFLDLKKRLTLTSIVMLICFNVFAEELVGSDDKNSSPYFIVLSGEDEIAKLPLKSTDINVNISGVIADVNVKQVYTNTGKTTIEAIYVFPASTRAAVYSMQMRIGDRVIKAQIQEKKKARDMYENAKRQGKKASLLEEERPNVFKMNVANITPGSTIEVNMSYTELLIPTDKVYEFVYPTVVGPRYVSKGQIESKTDEGWTGNPYLHQGENPTSVLNLKVHLNSGIPIQEISCTTHKNKIDYLSKTNATITLNEPEGGNRDFVTRYRLAGDAIETGVLLYDDPSGEKYFLAMVQPPKTVNNNEIPAREYVFIVDVSGSMKGFPLAISKQLLKDLLSNLSRNDKFNIVFFAGSSSFYSDKSLSVTPGNIKKAIEFMDSQSGYGSTELLTALETAMKSNTDDNYARTFVIITDGYVNVEKQTFDYIRQNLGKANFFSFGIGSSVNRYIIEGMAHVGYGEPFIALNNEEATKQAAKFANYISKPVLTNINYQFNGINAYDVLPDKVPDLFAERPIIISGKYKGDANGFIKIQGTTGKSDIAKSIEIKADKSDNKALKYLWAREKIRLLGDYASLGNDSWGRRDKNIDTLKTIITQLGLKYSLLTEYTSFIAIDTLISNQGGEQQTVTQPLPLPQGVSDKAVGGIQPPSACSQMLNIVSDDVELEDEFVVTVEMEEEVVEEEVFLKVEKMPSFKGGDLNTFREWVMKRIKYPKVAAENYIQGTVYVSFVVNEKGEVADVKVIRSIDPLLDAEAVRVVKSSPKWTPGEQRGKRVQVKYVIPVRFVLGK